MLAGRQTDERASVARANRPVARVDDTRQLACDRRLPAIAGTMVDVLRIGLVPARALRCDENRRTLEPVEGLLDEAHAPVRSAARRQPVQEVHDGVAHAACAVAGRKVDDVVERAADRLRPEVGVALAHRVGGRNERCNEGACQDEYPGSLHVT